MRIIVLFFGFVGVLLTGFMGVMLYFLSDFVALLRAQENQELNGAIELFLSIPRTTAYEDTGMFLAVAAVYGLLGTILAFARCGWQGAIMLLLPVLFTGLMHPASLIFSGVQAVAAIFSFFVYPLPIETEDARDEADDIESESEPEEDEEPLPRSKPKPKLKRRVVEDDED